MRSLSVHHTDLSSPCPLLAQSGHAAHRTECSLLGQERTSARDAVLIGGSKIFLDVGELILTFGTEGNFNLERIRTSKCCLLRWGILVRERHNGTADHVDGDNLFRGRNRHPLSS